MAADGCRPYAKNNILNFFYRVVEFFYVNNAFGVYFYSKNNSEIMKGHVSL